MMGRTTKLSSFVLLAAIAAMVTATASVNGVPMHERKEVAGLAIVFGAEPEPALTEEMQFLRWRVSTLADEEPYGDFQDPSVVIARNGEEFGPFAVRGVRSQSGSYQTRHIFTEAGEYESVLSFRKGDEETVHAVDFTFNINDRSDLEIPKRGRASQGGDADDIADALNVYAAAITSKSIEAIGDWVTEDLLIFEGAGVNRGWADYRDHHLGPELEMFDAINYEFSDIQAEASGNLAWANFRYSVHIEMPERVSDSGGVGTAVLVKGNDGRWRLRHLHTTPERRRQ